MAWIRDLIVREEDPSGCHRVYNAWMRHRHASLQLSQRKIFQTVHRGGINWMDLETVENRYLLSCASDGSLAIFDTLFSQNADSTTHEALITINKRNNPGHAHSAAASACAWYPIDNGIFVSGGYDGMVKVWDANNLTVGAFFAIQSTVFNISMSSIATSHALIAVGSTEPDVLLCDINSGGFSHRLSGHRNAVWAVAWSPLSEWEIYTGGRDGQIRVWDIRQSGTRVVLDLDDTARKRKNTTSKTKADMYITSHISGITGIIPSPDGLYWISAGNDDRVRLWNAATHCHELVHYNETFNRASKPRQLAVSDDCSVFFHPSGSSVQVFNVHSGASVATLTDGHFESIHACVWNPVAQELYSGGNDHHIVVWSPRILGKFDGGTGEGDEYDDDKDSWSD